MPLEEAVEYNYRFGDYLAKNPGATSKEIREYYGISIERVYQIMRRNVRHRRVQCIRVGGRFHWYNWGNTP